MNCTTLKEQYEYYVITKITDSSYFLQIKILLITEDNSYLSLNQL